MIERILLTGMTIGLCMVGFGIIFNNGLGVMPEYGFPITIGCACILLVKVVVNSLKK